MVEREAHHLAHHADVVEARLRARRRASHPVVRRHGHGGEAVAHLPLEWRVEQRGAVAQVDRGDEAAVADVGQGVVLCFAQLGGQVEAGLAVVVPRRDLRKIYRHVGAQMAAPASGDGRHHLAEGGRVAHVGLAYRHQRAGKRIAANGGYQPVEERCGRVVVDDVARTHAARQLVVADVEGVVLPVGTLGSDAVFPLSGKRHRLPGESVGIDRLQKHLVGMRGHEASAAVEVDDADGDAHARAAHKASGHGVDAALVIAVALFGAAHAVAVEVGHVAVVDGAEVHLQVAPEPLLRDADGADVPDHAVEVADAAVLEGRRQRGLVPVVEGGVALIDVLVVDGGQTAGLRVDARQASHPFLILLYAGHHLAERVDKVSVDVDGRQRFGIDPAGAAPVGCGGADDAHGHVDALFELACEEIGRGAEVLGRLRVTVLPAAHDYGLARCRRAVLDVEHAYVQIARMLYGGPAAVDGRARPSAQGLGHIGVPGGQPHFAYQHLVERDDGVGGADGDGAQLVAAGRRDDEGLPDAVGARGAGAGIVPVGLHADAGAGRGATADDGLRVLLQNHVVGKQLRHFEVGAAGTAARGKRGGCKQCRYQPVG